MYNIKEVIEKNYIILDKDCKQLGLSSDRIYTTEIVDSLNLKESEILKNTSYDDKYKSEVDSSTSSYKPTKFDDKLLTVIFVILLGIFIELLCSTIV